MSLENSHFCKVYSSAGHRHGPGLRRNVRISTHDVTACSRLVPLSCDDERRVARRDDGRPSSRARPRTREEPDGLPRGVVPAAHRVSEAAFVYESVI